MDNWAHFVSSGKSPPTPLLPLPAFCLPPPGQNDHTLVSPVVAARSPWISMPLLPAPYLLITIYSGHSPSSDNHGLSSPRSQKPPFFKVLPLPLQIRTVPLAPLSPKSVS